MTVCIALICSTNPTIDRGPGFALIPPAPNLVMGMADRLITFGDVQHAPPTSKIIHLTTSIVAMIAGDAELARDLIGEVKQVLAQRPETDPTRWWLVSEAADIWRDVYIRRWKREAELEVLAKVGLTHETFLADQGQMQKDLLLELAMKLATFRLPGVSVIIAGLDPTGPHVYRARGGSVLCLDMDGYAAIGEGDAHAEIELMFANHTPHSSPNSSIFHCYSAKKRAELAGSVGPDTDTFVVDRLGGASVIRQDVVQPVQDAFDAVTLRIAQLRADVVAEISAQVGSVIASTNQRADGAAQAREQR